MSSAHKEHMKELKAPDQFQASGLKAVNWLAQHVRLVLMFVVPLVVVALAFFAFQYVETQRKNSRLEALGEVDAAFDSEARKASDERQALGKRIEAIDQALAPKAADAKPQLPTPAQAAEKASLEKQAQQIKPDHSASAQRYLAFFKEHESVPEGWIAGMTAAHVLIEQGKGQEARPVLEAILSQSKNDAFYQMQGRIALIGLLEQLGDYDKALAEVDGLDKVAFSELKPTVLITKGRLQMLKNDKVAAKATLTSLIEGYGTSAEAQKARTMLAQLNT